MPRRTFPILYSTTVTAMLAAPHALATKSAHLIANGDSLSNLVNAVRVPCVVLVVVFALRTATFVILHASTALDGRLRIASLSLSLNNFFPI